MTTRTEHVQAEAQKVDRVALVGIFNYRQSNSWREGFEIGAIGNRIIFSLFEFPGKYFIFLRFIGLTFL